MKDKIYAFVFCLRRANRQMDDENCCCHRLDIDMFGEKGFGCVLFSVLAIVCERPKDDRIV